MVIQDQQGTGDVGYMKDSFEISDTLAELIINLPADYAGELIKMVVGYAFGEGCNNSDSPAINAMFSMFKMEIDKQWQRHS